MIYRRGAEDVELRHQRSPDVVFDSADAGDIEVVFMTAERSVHRGRATGQQVIQAFEPRLGQHADFSIVDEDALHDA